ncbi:MAG: YqgE/AlgH family protein [Caulobacteraceae bacterium]
MPNIGDPRFHRGVLLICIHDERQAMGIMLNRPFSGVTVPGLLRRLDLNAEGVPDAPVLFGGPMETERGYVIHTDDYVATGATLPVTDGVALTDTRDVLEAMADPTRRPRRSLLALGYAGWAPGQLEQELHQGAWLACDADDELVFGRDYDHKWTWALAKLGVTADRLSIEGGQA